MAGNVNQRAHNNNLYMNLHLDITNKMLKKKKKGMKIIFEINDCFVIAAMYITFIENLSNNHYSQVLFLKKNLFTFENCSFFFFLNKQQ